MEIGGVSREMGAARKKGSRPKVPICLFIFALLIMAHGWAWAEVEKKPPPSKEAEGGRPSYDKWCAGCHGMKGEGDGPAADYLDPRPRDFTQGTFKIRRTLSGELPLDEDILHVIANGMPGSSMPGWKEKFSEKELHQLVAYIKGFIDPGLAGGEPPQAIAVGKAVPSSNESVVKGREVYKKLKCWECHGENGRGDGPSAPTLKDDWDNHIKATDQTKGWTFRGGNRASDIYRTFTTGLNGTPMPSYMDTLNEEDRWHLANYVESLSPPQMPPVKAVLISREIKGEIPMDPDAPAWQRGEDSFYPLSGQIVFEPRLYKPSVDSIFIKSLYNDQEIAFLVTWNDRTKNAAGPGPDKYDDGLALQFPVQVKENERPHFVMGDAGNPVNIWKWKAQSDAVSEANASGPAKYLPQGPESQGLKGGAVYKQGQWRLVIKRSLVTQDQQNDLQFQPGVFIPVSFMVWDGDNGETGARMAVSSWYYLTIEKSATAGLFVYIPLAVLAAVGIEVLARRKALKSASRGAGGNP